MSLSSGARLGPYEIVAPLGAGGMGEVYEALDTRLDRRVAVKVLPERFADDEKLRRRFEQEARAVSSLNHPHICGLYDVGQEGDIHFMVMELLEGESLVKRLEKGALPIEAAFRYGVEISDALDKAHRKGVVHRDLKPGNIVLTSSGAKLLDFGLAKLRPVGLGTEALSSVATEAKPHTERGTILGTVPYMAPEQLEGEEADARTDLFAFGAVLYEMVTGRKAFEGKSPASLISAIMSSDPRPPSEIQPVAPRALDRVLKKCLAKDRDARWQTALDLRDELSWILEADGDERTPSSTPTSRSGFARAATAVAAVLALGVGLGAVLSPAPEAPRPLQHFAVPLPPDLTLPSAQGSLLAISPDGTKLAFMGERDGVTQLFLREMGDPEVRGLPGTERARHPAFSPDGEFVAFDDQNGLHKTSVTRGTRVLLSEKGVYPVWGPDGMVYFWNEGLWRVSAEAGEPEMLAAIEDSRNGRPKLVGGHGTVLFESLDAVEVLSLKTGERRVIAENARSPFYVASGHVLFASEGALFGVPFDPVRARVTGRAVPIGRGVRVEVGGAAQFAVSEGGALVYVEAGSAEGRLVEVNRRGEPRPLGQRRATLRHPRLSPDGRRVAVEILAGVPDVWVQELDRDVLTRITFEGGASPIWSPDGSRILFYREGGAWETSADGTGMERKLPRLEGARSWRATSWSSTGDAILFMATRHVRGWDIDVLRTDSEEAETVLGSGFSESEGVFSPGGRFVAFTSNESGRSEVFVVPFPDASRKWQISTDGGAEPQWSRDGTELFYRSGDRMMAVAIETRPEFSPGRPVFLFEKRIGDGGGDVLTNYDVDADGAGFVMIQNADGAGELQVVLNWFSELEVVAPGSH